MNILAFFTNNGIPATGLTPTIRIRDVSDNSLLVTDASMSEVGDGNYKYDFTTYDYTKDYSIRCDGGVILSDRERYTFGGNENYIEDISDAVWEEETKSHITSGSFGLLVQNTNTNVLSVSASVKENSDDLKRILGLTHENIFIDNPVYSSDGDLTSARLRIYSNPASVGTGSDVIGTYQISAPISAPGQFTTWKQVRTN